MLKSTILSIAAFMFLFIIWAVTPVRADCPHKENFNHKHCDNVPTESSAVSAVVTDSQGAFVGPLVESAVGGASLVLRQDVDTAVRFEVTEAGLNETSLTLNYESTNCIGPELMSPAAPNLSADGINRGTTVYYAPSGGAMLYDPSPCHRSKKSTVLSLPIGFLYHLTYAAMLSMAQVARFKRRYPPA